MQYHRCNVNIKEGYRPSGDTLLLCQSGKVLLFEAAVVGSGLDIVCHHTYREAPVDKRK